MHGHLNVNFSNVTLNVQKSHSVDEADLLGKDLEGVCHGLMKHSNFILGDTRWRIWLRHCATSLKFAVSIPDCVIRIFR